MSADDSLSAAEQIFDQFLHRVEQGEVVDFEKLVGDHPEHSSGLRRMHENWQMIRALKGERRSGTRSGGETSADPGCWNDFIQQLESKAPESSRYQVGAELARGGMGAVFTVYEESLRRTLAMKVALPRGGQGELGDPRSVDPLSMGRFLEEAQVTAQLDHPGIVPIYELSVNEQGRVFFTMKLVRGENLSEIFRKVTAGAGGWDQTRVLWVLLRACEALAFAHSRGVIHRDLKPANIMVGRFGETYVMDWGVARVLGRNDRHDLRIRSDPDEAPTRVASERRDDVSEEAGSPLVTMDGEVVGTPAYMPPEQAAGQIERLGPPSDVYGMGAILYELFAEHMPYVERGQRASPRSVLRWVLDGPPKPIQQISPHVPPELVAICEQAMAREMADRYPSMEELADDLRAYLEQRVVRAYAAGPLAELKKWMLRNKAVALLALILIVVVGGLGFGLAWQQSRANRIIADERDRAEAERRRVLRISDARRLEELLAEMDMLWPALPETGPKMHAWIERARDLLSRLPQHEETLAELRSRAKPGPHRLDAEMAEFLEHKRKDLAVPLSEGGEEFKTEQERASHVAELDYWIEEMQKVMDRERSFSFGDDQDTAWWHDTLYELVMGLRDLADEQPIGRTIQNIQERLEYAESTVRLSFDVYAAEWDLAISSISEPDECPQYGGFELEAQLGLVPLGRDPESGLWEFWHIQTGAKPERTERGELVYTDDCGLVFVLIPGGSFQMGAQGHALEAPNYDPAARPEESDEAGETVEIRLDPFLLSKYEMTQGQWLRIAGENPSHHDQRLRLPDLRQHTLLYPVESITWDTAVDLLEGRLRLKLPSEAQWEYACRAGTTSPWWTGSERESLLGAVNLADRSTSGAGVDWLESRAWAELEDGYFGVAPVNLFRPNPFGLHNTCGNVWEWVQDSYVHYRETWREGDGLREVTKKMKVVRGGSFNTTADACRSANRGRLEHTHLTTAIGVRPARALAAR